MDTTPGRTRARRIDADERTELMKAGKCFTCKKQGVTKQRVDSYYTVMTHDSKQ